jgi:hypothetical protein
MPRWDDHTSQQHAIFKAREALGLDISHPASIWPVTRLKPNAHHYFLVVFGTEQASVGIAVVDSVSDAILEKATLPGRQSHQLLTAEEAIQRAGLGSGTKAALVWEPSHASRSPFYPLWQLAGPTETVFVDSIQGTIWKSLSAKRGGGGAKRHQ